MNYRDYFKDKKITIAGLGENNKALMDAQFLARLGASVIVADTSDESLMKDVIQKIKSNDDVETELHDEALTLGEEKGEQIMVEIAKKKKKNWRDNITFAFGPFKKEHFENRDLILRDMSLSPHLAVFEEAKAHNIPVEVPECLFIKLAPPITLIGVTGTCGKSTVAAIINEILKKSFKSSRDEQFYFIDPYRGFSPLALLAKIEREDVVLIECPTDLLHEFDAMHISPHIAVVTNLIPDQITTYGSKEDYFNQIATILKYQTYNNFFIGNDEVVDFIKAHFKLPFKAKILRTSVNIIPSSWNLAVNYYHMKENISLSMRVAEMLHVSFEDMQDAVENFKGLKGRLEQVKKVRGATYYNDGTSTHPQATLVALKCLSHNKNCVLIWGGMTSGVPLDDFLMTMPQYVSTLILLPGSGTLVSHRSILEREDIKAVYAHSVYDAVARARDHAGKGDSVIFSPGFKAHTAQKNEVARGEHFVWALRGIV